MAAARSESGIGCGVLGRTPIEQKPDHEDALPRTRKHRQEMAACGLDQLVGELGQVKHELAELKLRFTSASAAKARSEDEAAASRSKAASISQSIEETRKQIDASEEELVLVELARIEAGRECREIKAARSADAAEFAKKIRAFSQEIKRLGEQDSRREELQIELDITNSAIAVLQVELDAASADYKLGESKWEANSRHRLLLAAAIDELEAASKELASANEEGFQSMNAMDRIREEMVYIAEKSSKLKRLEKKAESTAAHLEVNLLKAKTKLEAMTMAESRTRAIASNLSAAALQLESEADAAAREKESIGKENRRIRYEIERIEAEICSAEEKLRALPQALLEAKAAEATAVKKVRKASKSAMRRRTSKIPFCSTITVCKSEHDYLIKKAAAAEKKVAAANAWREAAADRERKAASEAKAVEKETREMRAVRVRELHETQKSVFARRSLEVEMNKLFTMQEEEDDDNHDEQGRSDGRRWRSNRLRRINQSPLSPAAAAAGAARQIRSPLIVIKKRRKVMPNLVKFMKDRHRN